MKKYHVSYNESEEMIEVESTEIGPIIEEEFNEIKSRGEQQDIYDEIRELSIGEEYVYYRHHDQMATLRIKRVS
ncbi:MAG: hypothetical protein KID02_15950 [Clostridiales bacterium]|nr:hypothetical protein [Clostridiales bacterium]